MKKVCVFVLILIVLTSPVFSVCPDAEEFWAPIAIAAIPAIPLIGIGVPGALTLGLLFIDSGYSNAVVGAGADLLPGMLTAMAVSLPIGMVSGMVLNATCSDAKTFSLFNFLYNDIGTSLLYAGYGLAAGFFIGSLVPSDSDAWSLGAIIGAIAGFVPTLVIEIAQYW